LLYWGYIVTFTKVLNNYYSWIHPFHHSPLSWSSFKRSHFSVFEHEYIVFPPYSPSFTLSLHSLHWYQSPDRTCFTFWSAFLKKTFLFVSYTWKYHNETPCIAILFYLFFSFFIIFICAYNVWVISAPFPQPPPLPPPNPTLPGRNYFALISSFVEERV
jgi:hypothetical protein